MAKQEQRILFHLLFEHNSFHSRKKQQQEEGNSPVCMFFEEINLRGIQLVQLDPEQHNRMKSSWTLTFRWN